MMPKDYNQILRDYLNNPLAPEIYKLWYEYLKKNETYEIFCKWAREVKETPAEKILHVPDELKHLSHESLKDIIKTFYDWGDIHSLSWEDKLIGICKRIKENNKIIESNEDLNQVYPAKTLEELITRCFVTGQENYLTLQVPLNAPAEDLIEQFKNIVIKKQKEIKGEKIVKSPFPKPSKKLIQKNINLLRRYLTVYDLKENQKLAWKQIIKKVDLEGKIHPGDHHFYDPKVWRVERDNARDIIKNVGQNIFPGKYGETKRRKERKNLKTGLLNKFK